MVKEKTTCQAPNTSINSKDAAIELVNVSTVDSNYIHNLISVHTPPDMMPKMI